MAPKKMNTKTDTVHMDHISKDRTTFEMYCGGKWRKDIHMDLLKNKKDVLEAIATRVLFGDLDKTKKFRETKPKLVEMILTLLRFETPEDPDDWERVSYETKDFGVPAGTYYHGDLCYDMKDSIYDGIWGDKFGYAMGVYRRKSDGAMFGMFDTGGDGLWKEHYGKKEYPVDAGNLGIASKVLCYGGSNDPTDYITFNDETECWAGGEDEDCQMFVFGHIEISDRHYRDEDEENSSDEEDSDDD